ncbi:MAG: redoxin domain-containing protein [candidate division KSB1 bacterium]|nr:redoxin domain-containing protein [candidate division KSB1 bacterium]MDZ7342513.1 redoxin domain-containing protein [candidate division KSB1 bacterium]
MKAATMLFSAVLILGVLVVNSQSQNFTYIPTLPQLNQKITLTYQPKGGPLANVQSIQAVIHQFSDQSALPTSAEIAMTRRGPNWSSTIKPAAATKAIFVVFQSDDRSDDNNHQGYAIPLYDAKGSYLPGTLATMAKVYFSGGYPMQLKRDPQLALEKLQQEFALFPTQKSEHLELYWQLILATDKANGKARVQAQVDSIAAKSNLTLDEKKRLANWYTYQLQQPEKAEAFKKEIRLAEPQGELVQTERFQKFYAEKDLNTKRNLLTQFKNDFPQSERIANMEMMLINAYVQAQKYDDARALLEAGLTKPSSVPYNTVAWDMIEKDFDLPGAAALAQQGVALARQELNAPTTEKPSYLTERQWLNTRQNSLGFILDTYAYALYRLGRVAESVPLFQEAVQLTQQSNADINERYARALQDVGQHRESYQFLDGLIKAGKSSPACDELFKQAYIRVKGSESGLDQYFAKLKQEGSSKLKEKLQQEMLNLPAPEFSLADLAGNTISLKSLQGKVVVVDFWATWCGPCLASFPGMKQAVEKFQASSDVEFLFINTWERGDNIKKRVSDFIEDKNYPFHVLLDSKNDVVAAYNVDGIPTKFVIDKSGVIRFKSVGFGGDTDKMVEELSLMIEMIR